MHRYHDTVPVTLASEGTVQQVQARVRLGFWRHWVDLLRSLAGRPARLMITELALRFSEALAVRWTVGHEWHRGPVHDGMPLQVLETWQLSSGCRSTNKSTK